MNSISFLFSNKVIIFILIIFCSYTSCTKKNSTIPPQSEEWQQETSLSERLRLNTGVHEVEDKVFLLPATGSFGYWQHAEFGWRSD